MTSEAIFVQAIIQSNGEQWSEKDTIDLSSMQLKSIHSNVLNQCATLVSLDLSNNFLSHLPTDLLLPHLRRLDLQGNNIDDVSFLICFSATLKELNLKENTSIGTSKKFIIMDMLPQLEVFNGQTDLHDMRLFVNANRKNLMNRLNNLWMDVMEESFDPRKDKAEDVLNQFVELGQSLREQYTCLFESEAFDYFLRLSCESVLMQNGFSCSKASAKLNSMNELPIKIRRVPEPDIAAMREKQKLRSLKKRTDESFNTMTILRTFAETIDSGKPSICCGAFEPDAHDAKSTLPNIAICADGNLAIINCETDEIVNRFSPGNNIGLTCLAWTTLSTSNVIRGKTFVSRKFNVIACGSSSGDIFLLYPAMNVHYSTLEGHKLKVMSLAFSRTITRTLFSCDAAEIFEWDIGEPQQGLAEGSFKLTKVQKKRHLDVSGCCQLLMASALQFADVLLAVADREICAWVALRTDQDPFPVRMSMDVESRSAIDRISELSEGLIVVKQLGGRCAYIFNLNKDAAVFKTTKNKSVIKPIVRIDFSFELALKDVRLASVAFEQKLISIGRLDGELAVFSLADSILSSRSQKTLVNAEPVCRARLPPAAICGKKLNNSGAFVNDIAIGADSRYCVLMTSNNLIYILKNESCG